MHPDEPKQPQSILQQAMQRHQQGDLFEADVLYVQALKLDPANSQALRLRGIIARERGDIDQSLQLLQQAHDAAPTNPDPLGEMALSYMAAGELANAEATLRQALELHPAATRILANLGALLQHRGHVMEAIDCYRQLLAIEPDDIEVRCNLAKALADAGNSDEALHECDVAEKFGNGHPHVLATRGAVLTDDQRYADARQALEASLQLEPYYNQANDMALVNLALACYELNDIATACQVLQQAVSANPWNARAVADLANCLSALDRTDEAVELCQRFLRENPGERLVIGACALALHNAGRFSEARELSDCDSLVRVYDIACPPRYDNLAEFNNALAERIRNDASLLTNPVSKSTHGGAQTGELDLTKNDCLTDLASCFSHAIAEAADSYIDAGLQHHPLMVPATDDWSLRTWGTILRAGGRQTAHMHPLGWLSGVYYVRLPEDMSASASEAGWLEFGRPPERFFRTSDPATARYEPRAGRLILFPSWFWHQTLPFESKSDRISIAFDVMPRALLRIL